MENQIEVLANKLGVAVSVLWPALVRRAVIDGITGLFLSLALLCGGVYLVFYAQRKMKSITDEAFRFLLGVGIGIVLLFSIQFVCWIHEACVILFSPEAQALLYLTNGK